nr:HEPN domain-containing protein [Salibacterium salarium]
MGRVRKMAKERWGELNHFEGFWCGFYKSPQLTKSEFEKPIRINFDQEIVLINYFDSISTFNWDNMVEANEEGEIKLTNPEEKTSSSGVYILIIVPGKISTREEAFNRIEEISGTLSITQGKNFVKDYITSSFYFFDGNGRVNSIPFNPDVFHKPSVENENLKKAMEIQMKVRDIENDEKRSKVKLSLRWFYKSLSEDGVDAFIKLWIAIEAIGKDSFNKSEDNLKDIKMKFRSIYSEFKDPSSHFQLGPLFSLRSNIVHKGEFVNIDNKVMRYLECIYKDLLDYELKMHNQEYSKSCKENFEIDVLKYVKN